MVQNFSYVAPFDMDMNIYYVVPKRSHFSRANMVGFQLEVEVE